jgi:hypothetical protein
MIAPVVVQDNSISNPSHDIVGTSGVPSSTTVQLVGIPLLPVVQVTLAFFTKVPVDETRLTQFVKQFDADLSTARHKM